LGTVSAADFVFEPLWQLAGDRLTAHNRQQERERGMDREAAPSVSPVGQGV